LSLLGVGEHGGIQIANVVGGHPVARRRDQCAAGRRDGDPFAYLIALVHRVRRGLPDTPR
jgi:hypothetical protein